MVRYDTCRPVLAGASRLPVPVGGVSCRTLIDRCRLSSVGQSDALVMRRSTVRFRQAALAKAQVTDLGFAASPRSITLFVRPGILRGSSSRRKRQIE